MKKNKYLEKIISLEVKQKEDKRCHCFCLFLITWLGWKSDSKKLTTAVSTTTTKNGKHCHHYCQGNTKWSQFCCFLPIFGIHFCEEVLHPHPVELQPGDLPSSEKCEHNW